MYLNIRSLNCNFENLNQLLTKTKLKPIVICLTETWMTPSKTMLHNLPGYNFISKDSNSKCGGCALFIKDNYKYNILNEYNLYADSCEDIWIDLELPGNKTIIIGNIYRHPNHNFNQFE